MRPGHRVDNVQNENMGHIFQFLVRVGIGHGPPVTELLFFSATLLHTGNSQDVVYRGSVLNILNISCVARHSRFSGLIIGRVSA